jgi:hypothetical protein
MRRNLACLFVLVGFGLLSGCVKKQTTWAIHNTPGCPVSTSQPELDRERTYLATILALQARGYAVMKAQAPSYIEATHTSGNSPGAAHVRWLISIGPDASLNVDVPPGEREMHPRVAGWYDSLLLNVSQLQCRDTNWLRWEAQNRGLVPIGAYEVGEAPAAATTGGEAGTLPPASTPAPSHVQVHPNAERLVQLEKERAEVRFVRPFAWAAAGVGVGIVGVTLAAYGAGFLVTGCEEDIYGYQDCVLRDAGRVLLPVGAALGAVAATLLVITLPRGFARLQKFRDLGREIKLLRAASLAVTPALGPAQSAWNVSLRGSF